MDSCAEKGFKELSVAHLQHGPTSCGQEVPHKVPGSC